MPKVSWATTWEWQGKRKNHGCHLSEDNPGLLRTPAPDPHPPPCTEAQQTDTRTRTEEVSVFTQLPRALLGVLFALMYIKRSHYLE